MKFILGTKKGMTQVFREDGRVVPVTRVQAGPCVVTQVKTKDKDRVNAVQIGFGDQKMFRLTKAGQGHLKGLEAVRHMRDIATGDSVHNLNRGDVFTVNTFEKGDKIQVTGTSKGKGFQGVVKRHGFSGSLKTHGHKDQHRMPGSIGATGPARVFKGTRMGGRMGGDQVTVKNLEVVGIDPENNELLIKGAVPGARGGLLIIKTDDGEIKVEAKDAPVVVQEETAGEEAPKSEEVQEETVSEEAPAEAEAKE